MVGQLLDELLAGGGVLGDADVLQDRQEQPVVVLGRQPADHAPDQEGLDGGGRERALLVADPVAGMQVQQHRDGGAGGEQVEDLEEPAGRCGGLQVLHALHRAAVVCEVGEDLSGGQGGALEPDPEVGEQPFDGDL